MIQSHGIYLPDGDTHMVEYFDKVRDVDGRGAYQHEKWLRAKRDLTSWRTAVDIGAHVGTWTLTLATHFQHVICFEPMPKHVECWLKNVHAPNVSLYEVALGAADGVVEIALERAGWSGCTRVIGPHETVDLASPKISVPVHRLDDYELTTVDFIKVDCEGFEKFVLQGGESLIRRDRPAIIVEQKPGLAKRYGLPDIGAVTWLEALGMVRRWEQAGDYFLTWPKRA